MKISHEQLKEALVAATLADFQDVPVEEEIDYTFSGSFEAWAEKLLRQMRSGKRYVSTAGRVLRAILIAAIIAALLAGTAMAIPAVRERILKIFIRRDEHFQYVEYYTGDDVPTEVLGSEPPKSVVIPGVKTEVTVIAEAECMEELPEDVPVPIEYRSPTYLPEKMHVESEAYNPFAISTVMRAKNGTDLSYFQSLSPRFGCCSTARAFGDDFVHSEVLACGIQMDSFKCATTWVLIWEDEFYQYELHVDSDLPIEEVEKIILSIAPRDDLNNPTEDLP